MLRFECAQISSKGREDRALALAHDRRRDLLRVQPPQLSAPRSEQLRRLRLSRATFVVARDFFRPPLRRKPPSETRLFDGHGERLIECGVPGHVDQLMGQLVKDESRELMVAVTHHRTDQWIRESAERGIRGHSTDRDIEALRGERQRVVARAALLEVASIRDAAHDGKTPLSRLDRELRSRDDVPHDEWPVDPRVAAITRIVRQPEFATREGADLRGIREPIAHIGGSSGIGDYSIHRLARRHQLGLAAGCLQEIAGPAARRDQRHRQRERSRCEACDHACMQVYLVGGAVRDAMLGLPVRERDWVVVGAMPETLEKQGYRPVGREFPVFLHPQTNEEYALARLERKVAPGYRGFTAQFSPDVTLEDDLRRRDLTINAIAQTETGDLVDPYDGQRDLRERVLRHVSEAFVEDPVRILRVARFAARFAPLGFTVAPETLALMRTMVASGEVNALVPERVWAETERALAEARPDVYVQTLRDAGALAVIFPEIDKLFGVPQPAQWHPEIDTGTHLLMTLRMAARLGASDIARFAVLTHDLGKGTTPAHVLPSHHGHEGRSVALVDALCDRLRIPNEHRAVARLVAQQHGNIHRAFELRASTILDLFDSADAFRRKERIPEMLMACEADARGRLGFEERAYPQRDYLLQCFAAASSASLSDEERVGLEGRLFGERLRRKRLAAIDAVKAGVASPATESH